MPSLMPNSLSIHPSFPRRSRCQTGSTLIMVMFMIAILGVFIGLACDYTANTALVSRRGRDLSACQALANGALETTYKRWQEFMLSNQATSANTGFGTDAQFNGTAGITPALMTKLNAAASSSGYQLTSLSVNLVDRADNLQPLGISAQTPSTTPLANVPGWVAKTYSYKATAVVQKVNDPSVSTSISRYFQEADASPFQAMLFFQDDLELNPGNNMTLTGLVHTNKNMYTSTRATLTYNSQVSYSGDGTNSDGTAKPSTLNPASNYIAATANKFGSGYIEGVTQTLYNIEDWTSFNAPTYANGINNQLSKVDPLYPLGTDVDAAVKANPNNPNATSTHEIIDRPSPTSATNPSANSAYTDPDAFKAHRIWNSAGLRILINRADKNPVHVYVPGSADGEVSTELPQGTGLAAQIATAITPDTSGSLYDMRETRSIHTDTVDMSVLTPILNSYASYNGVVYISDITSNAAQGGTSNDAAIRIKKGGTLPGTTTDASGNTTPNASNVDGLTVASDGAVYVQGDYNTGTTYGPDVAGIPTSIKQPASNLSSDTSAAYTVTNYTQKPASIMGDAVMVLSNNWKDATSSGGANASIATSTTFNAAIVSGIVPTDLSSGSQTASGGAHNFPRFLENWVGKNLTYHGSMVELYQSKYFTAPWNSSHSVYQAPARLWYFDTRFLTNYPPGNLRLTTYGRSRWVQNPNS